jgi:hypothetical protein
VRVRIPPRVGRWLEALGWHKDMGLKVDKNPDGSVTVRRDSEVETFRRWGGDFFMLLAR